MEIKDVKVGMKVRLLDKPAWSSYNTIEEFYSDRQKDCCVRFFKKNGYGIVGEIDVERNEIRVSEGSCSRFGWVFCPKDLEPYTNAETFSREDLKDGMVLTDVNGYKKIIGNNGETYVSSYDWTFYPSTYLFRDGELDKSILKAEYNGEVIFQKSIYFTLEEAVASGKMFKHKDTNIDFVNRVYLAIFALDSMAFETTNGTEERNQYVLSQINSRVWEIKEDE